MNNKSATAVKDRAQVIERSADIDVRQVNVPVIVWSEWLHESISLGRLLGVPSIQQSSRFEHTVGRGRTHRHNVSVHHHVRRAAVSFEWILGAELDDCCSLFFS